MGGGSKVSGTALGAIGAGLVFVYAGLKGYSVTATIQAIIQGKTPAGQNQIAAIGTPVATAATTPAADGGMSPNQTSSAGIVKGSASQSQWAAALLAFGGWPNTAANQRTIAAWEAREGGGGANNPLNTTLPEPGATNFNSVGVKNYPSIQVGLKATVATLNGGGYGDILMYLRSGKGFQGISLAGLSRWSGGGYSSV